MTVPVHSPQGVAMRKKRFDTQVEVLRYLQEHPGSSARQVADALGLSLQWARKNLELLYVHKLVGRQASLMREPGKLVRWYAEVP